MLDGSGVKLVGKSFVIPGISPELGHRKENEMDTKKKKEKSAHTMTDKEVAQSVDLEVSDFSDDGSDLDELRNIMEGND